MRSPAKDRFPDAQRIVGWLLIALSTVIAVWFGGTLLAFVTQLSFPWVQ
jgi:hypothetical protein